MTIKQLYQEHEGKISDKWTLYLAEFDRLFLPYQNKDVRLLEIGVHNGGSLEIWAKYFGNAKFIVGCDIDAKCGQLRYEDDRIVVIVGDANSLDCQRRIIQGASQFDIIIDDASHKSGDIIRSFSRYFPCLDDCGLYIVEDLHCSYWNDFEGGLHNPFSSISFFKRLADIVNYEHWRNEKPRNNLYKEFMKKYEIELDDLTLAGIHSVEFVNSLCVIRKLLPEENKLGRRFIAGLEESVSNGWHKLDGTSVQEMAMGISDAEDHDVIELIKRIDLFNQTIAERDGHIANLGQTVTQRDNQSVSLNQVVTERDAQITSLSQSVTERDEQIVNLNQIIIDRDGQIASLNEAVASANNELNNATCWLNTIRSSRSMRITAPLRFAARLWRWGLVPDDCRIIERKLRKIFHGVPASPKMKAVLRNLYIRCIGQPLRETNGRPIFVKSFNKDIQEKSFCSAHVCNDTDFLIPDNWKHWHTPYDVIVLPIIDWHFRFQRPQQIARIFAEKGHRVAYAGLSFGAELEVESLEDGIDQLILPGRKKTNVYKEMPTKADANLMANALQRYISGNPHRPFVCIVQLPYWQPVVVLLRERTGCPIIYDCMDDHTGFSTNGDKMLAAESRLLEQANIVVVSSQVLFDKAKTIAKRIELIRNAADYAHFAVVPVTKHSTAGKYIVGYYGAIADWFDSVLVHELARLRPSWQFVLIGSTFSADKKALMSCPNISLVGEKPYSALPDLIKNWDCCIIPFKRLPLTEATNPVKVYEMLAAGKPVVSVSLPEIKTMAEAGYIALADTPEAFAREIEKEIKNDNITLQASRREYARENTWEKRLEAIDHAIRDLYPLVSIIIVTYNNLALNKLCLESVLYDTDYPNYEVIVVDNASSDGTPAYLRSLEYPRLTVILNEENRGFAAANNQGIMAAGGHYLCLLNNDTVVSGSWLSTLVGHLRSNPRVGLVGPVTNAIDNEACIPIGYKNLQDMPDWASKYCRRNNGRLESISMLAFFCVVIPRAVHQIVGPLDERFGIGMFEDDDYNHRVRDAGFEVKLARDSFVHHWQKASFNLLGNDKYLNIFKENEKKYKTKLAVGVLEERHREKFTRLAMSSRASSRTVIFAPSVGWNIHLIQRPHHLARILAKKGYTVVFDCSNSYDDFDFIKEEEPRLFLYKGPVKLLTELHKPVLWTFTYNYHYRDLLPEKFPVIYDWIDDLAVFSYDQAWLKKMHDRAVNEADVIVSVARKLHENILPLRPDAIYLPNAVDAVHFQKPPDLDPARKDHDFAEFIESGKPLAGYYGALAKWFDYDLLKRVAQLRPDWNFILIGPDYDKSIGKSKITKLSNIRWVGPRNYEQLPAYLHFFDVAMIPFKINEITLVTSPLKIFEYFAAGKPVVTTPMPECMAFPEVMIGTTPEEFADHLSNALAAGKDPKTQSSLRNIAEKNTWDNRIDLAMEALSKTEKASAGYYGVAKKFRALENDGNRNFFRALARHLNTIADDPCLPMYFQFALSANDRGRSVVSILEKITSIKGKRYLDIGCAYGGFLVAFGERGAIPVGLNIDKQLIELSKYNFKDAAQTHPIYQKDITNRDDIAEFINSFNLITCNDVIEHVSDPGITIQHIGELLTEDGVAYLEIPNRDSVSAVMSDGHYGLFAITQLEKEDAQSYYLALFPDRRYGVGHYLRLPEYEALITKMGMTMEILEEESLQGISTQNLINEANKLRSSVADSLQSVPAAIRGRVEKAIATYLENLNEAINKQDDPKSVLLTYGTSFWKILLRNKQKAEENEEVLGIKQQNSADLDRLVPDIFCGQHTLRGQCNVCGVATRFFYEKEELWRESLNCENCRTTSRYRSIARGIIRAIALLTGQKFMSLADLPHRYDRKIRVYDTQAPFYYQLCAYPLPDILREREWFDVVVSDYKPDRPLGKNLSRGIINQNLETLTFPDNSFDIVITSDVMEHVRLDDRAHREIFRVLKPGGIYIFTVPHNRAWEETLIRVQVNDPNDPSKDVHLMEPEYHGDANNSSNNGILAYRTYGGDLERRLEDTGFEVDYSKEDIRNCVIMNTELYFCRKMVGRGQTFDEI